MRIFIFILILLSNVNAICQNQKTENDLNEQIDFQKRQNLIKWSGISVYTIGSLSLYNIWYSQFEQESFHFFNDWGEWENVDKLGHIQASYFQSQLMYQGLKWSGIDKDKSILYSSLASLGFQSTIELMDGFSSGWGFSLTDYSANIIGISAFAFQQKYWDEQKVTFKVSFWPKAYSNVNINSLENSGSTNLKERSDDLFGSHLASKFIKDYNAQTIWVSANPSLFFGKTRWPEWLNISIGYGAENMYGGFNNKWTNEELHFELNSEEHSRYRQYILAFDYDLRKIKTRSPFLRSLLDILNIFKWPSPGIELTSKGDVHFHLIFTN